MFLCGWVRRLVFKRLKINVKQFDTLHELEKFGTMLENVLSDWEEEIKKRCERWVKKEAKEEAVKNAQF